jgi:hypothetical protein
LRKAGLGSHCLLTGVCAAGTQRPTEEARGGTPRLPHHLQKHTARFRQHMNACHTDWQHCCRIGGGPATAADGREVTPAPHHLLWIWQTSSRGQGSVKNKRCIGTIHHISISGKAYIMPITAAAVTAIHCGGYLCGDGGRTVSCSSRSSPRNRAKAYCSW